MKADRGKEVTEESETSRGWLMKLKEKKLSSYIKMQGEAAHTNIKATPRYPENNRFSMKTKHLSWKKQPSKTFIARE